MHAAHEEKPRRVAEKPRHITATFLFPALVNDRQTPRHDRSGLHFLQNRLRAVPAAIPRRRPARESNRRSRGVSASLRAALKSSFQANEWTSALNSLAISIVRSVEPVSTTTICDASSRTEARHRPRNFSSFFVMRQTVRRGAVLILRMGNVPEAARASRACCCRGDCP